jgi:hypothetical protein
MFKPVPYDINGTTNLAANRQPHGSQKEYAANLGGPIIKDVLQYFVNVDYVHNSLQSTPNDPQNVAANYLTQDSPAQQLNAYNAVMAGLGGLVTNNQTGGTMQSEMTTPWTDDAKHLTILGRLDWTINMENHASLRFNSQKYTGLNDTWSATQRTTNAASNNSTLKFNSTSWVAELESTLGGNIINDARFQIATEERPTIPNSTVMSLDLPGITEGGYYIDPRNTVENSKQLVDVATYIIGDFTLKGGIDWQWMRYTDSFYPDARGEISFSNWDSAAYWLNSTTPYPGAGTFTPTITYYQDYSPTGGVVNFGEKLFAQFLQSSYSGFMDKRLRCPWAFATPGKCGATIPTRTPCSRAPIRCRTTAASTPGSGSPWMCSATTRRCCAAASGASATPTLPPTLAPPS